MPSSAPAAPATLLTPEEKARMAYDSGVRTVADAEEFTADAMRQADARKQQKLRDKARKAYESAARRFERATELQAGMHQAWNYLGYCHRKLGRYDAALAAYDRALTLQPGYAEAIEYRGHAYLGLGRLSEAKEAYLALYGANRKLAASLLAAMQQWAREHDEQPEFAAWVSERTAIAGHTTALSSESVDASWH